MIKISAINKSYDFSNPIKSLAMHNFIMAFLNFYEKVVVINYQRVIYLKSVYKNTILNYLMKIFIKSVGSLKSKPKLGFGLGVISFSYNNSHKIQLLKCILTLYC